MAEPILTVEHLIKAYGETPVLDDISFAVKPGEVIVVVGPSGCGKSTLLRCLNGLEPTQSGRVRLGNETVAYGGKNLTQLRQRIGMVFQSYELFPHMTVLDNVLLAPTKVQKRPKAEVQQEAEALLDRVGLLAKKNSYPRELSGGQKQRVAIARALASDPEILLCDEATSALDPQTTEQILELLKKLNTELGITIVLITHEMQVIKKICHSVTVLENGRVAESGKVYDIFANPKADVTRSFAMTAGGLSVSGEALEKERRLPGKVLKLKFLDDSAGKAIISRLSRDYGIDFNIINGNIETIDGRTLGTLVVRAEGDEDKIEKAINDMSENGVKVGVI